jgi:hypothetical protein
MMEAQECCILGICCEPTLAVRTLAEKIDAEVSGINASKAMDIAVFIHAHYDLAPKGMIQPLIDLVAAEAREYPYRNA